MSLTKGRFRQVVRCGSDREIQEEAKRIFDESWDRGETVEMLAEVLKEEKGWQVNEFGNEVIYDGLKIRKGYSPSVEFTDDDC